MVAEGDTATAARATLPFQGMFGRFNGGKSSELFQ